MIHKTDNFSYDAVISQKFVLPQCFVYKTYTNQKYLIIKNIGHVRQQVPSFR